jgi:hypothetical protein
MNPFDFSFTLYGLLLALRSPTLRRALPMFGAIPQGSGPLEII